MSDQLVDAETANKKDLRPLEDALQKLWEKARSVSEALLRLKAENKELRDRISSLEEQERRALEDLRRREREIEQIRAQVIQLQSNGQNLFSKEETEALKARAEELITKINSRL
ncbi:MAG TPA: hypothetical protein VMU30_03155 [Bacteroidota bacterium]|nr:hypothetical protein [Bacteroidota bacterium]